MQLRHLLTANGTTLVFGDWRIDFFPHQVCDMSTFANDSAIAVTLQQLLVIAFNDNSDRTSSQDILKKK